MTPVERRRAALLFAAALLVRLAAIPLSEHPEIRPLTDAVQYDEMARAFVAGEWLTPLVVREPGYPAFLALAYALPGPEIPVRHALQSLLGAAVPALLYLGLAPFLRERVRLVAALAIAGNLHLIRQTALPLRENLVAALAAIALVALLRALHRPSAARLAGAALALSMLAHTDARFLALLATIPLVARLGGESRAWRSTVWIVAVSLALLVPWAMRTHAATGRVILLSERTLDKWLPRAFPETGDGAEGTPRQWLAGWERATESRRDGMSAEERAAFDAGVRPATGRLATYGFRWLEYWRFARTAPAYFPWPDGRFAPSWSTRHHAASALTLVPLLAFLPFFLCRAPSRERGVLLAIAALVLTHAILHVIVHARERYRIPIEPWLAVLAASGAVGVLQSIRTSLRTPEIATLPSPRARTK